MRRIIAVTLLAIAGPGGVTGCCCCCGPFYKDTIESYEYATPDDYVYAESKARKDRVQPVIEALEKFKARTGKYPASLESLVEGNSLDAIPNLADATDHKSQPGRLRNVQALKYKANLASTEYGLEFSFAQVGSRKVISTEVLASEQKHTYLSQAGKWEKNHIQSIDAMFNNYHGYDNSDLYHEAEAKARRDRLEPVIDALTKYKVKHGNYPESLDELVVQKFLVSLPNLKVKTDHKGVEGRIKIASEAIYKVKPDHAEYFLEFGYDEREHDRPNMTWAHHHSYISKTGMWVKGR